MTFTLFLVIMLKAFTNQHLRHEEKEFHCWGKGNGGSSPLLESIKTLNEEDGRLTRVGIELDPESRHHEVYQKSGVSSISILHNYFTGASEHFKRPSKILTELNVVSDINNGPYLEQFNEKVSFNFMISSLSVELPGPKSSTVVLNDDNILLWRYFYDFDNYDNWGRLYKMTLRNIKNNILNVFTVEYSDTS